MNTLLSLRPSWIVGCALVATALQQGSTSSRPASALPSQVTIAAEENAPPAPVDLVGALPSAGVHVFRIEDRDAAIAAGLEPTHRDGWYAVPDSEIKQDSPKVRAARTLATYETEAYLDRFNGLSWPNPALFVGFEPGATAKDRASALAAVGGAAHQYSHIPNLALVRLDTKSGADVAARVGAVSRMPGVAFAEPDMAFTGRAEMAPHDAAFPWQWEHLNTGWTGGLVDFDMKTTLAWDLGIGSSAVAVLVMDSGIQPDHPDLNVLPGRDFTTGATDGTPIGEPLNSLDNHGTPVAGCISGRINNSLGGAGVAPGCPSVSARIFNTYNASGYWTADMSWSVNALNWGLANGILITNNSSQYGTYSTQSVSAAYAATRAAGAIHFSIAGNFGSLTMLFPANDPSVLAVGAAARTGIRASFSSYGPKLAFLAPGSSVSSTDRTGADGYSAFDYSQFSGTSFASPIAAGVAALMRSRNPAITPDEITAILCSTARDMGVPGRDDDTGCGLIDAAAAVAAVTPAPYSPCAPANPILIQGSNSRPLNQTTAADLVLGNSGCASVFRKANFFKFTPTLTGTYTISACAGGSDLRMAVVTDCANPAGALLACSQSSSCTGPASATLALTGGAPVYVMIGGGSAADLPTPISVTVVPPAVPACATTVDASFGANPFDTSASALIQLVKANPLGTQTALISKALWFAFTPSVTGAYSFKTCGASGDTSLAIGTSCPAFGTRFECIAYNGDAPSCFAGADPWASWIDATNNGATGTGAGFPLAQDLVAGTTYYICIGGRSPITASITGTLAIDGPPQIPPNPADLNGDGIVNAADLATLLSGWALAGPTDLDGDGTTGAPDLAILLNAWTT
jgi:subtilisin family serine protease